ncbi:hypothetical protein R4576_18040 [Acinetobacter baumannii]|nr:hypothetical protein [Acinetobacter baumannii]
MEYISNERGQFFYEGSLVVTVKATGTVYFVSKEMLVIKAYKKNAKKAFISTRYKSFERIKEVVKASIESEVSFFNLKQTQKVEASKALKKFRDELEVGTILYTSWGYEQTNVEFYQVVSVKGAFCEIREVAKVSHDLTDMSGKVIPKPNSFIGEPIKRKILNGYVKIHNSANASPLPFKVLSTGTKVYEGRYESSYY